MTAGTLLGHSESFSGAQASVAQSSTPGYAGTAMGTPLVCPDYGGKRPREEIAYMAVGQEGPTVDSEEYYQDPGRRTRARVDDAPLEDLERSPVLYLQEFFRRLGPEFRIDILFRGIAMLQDPSQGTLDRLHASEGTGHLVGGPGGKRLVMDGSIQENVL